MDSTSEADSDREKNVRNSILLPLSEADILSDAETLSETEALSEPERLSGAEESSKALSEPVLSCSLFAWESLTD